MPRDEVAALPDAIAIRDLTVRFGTGDGSVLAVDRASFSVAPGEFVSLVGPSGCGKTTILNLLAGLLTETPEGHASLLGKAPSSGNRDIAYMLARDSLMPWRTALGNAVYGMEIRNVPATEREARARALLERVGPRRGFTRQISQGPVARHAPALRARSDLRARQPGAADGRAVRRARRADQAAARGHADRPLRDDAQDGGVRDPRPRRGRRVVRSRDRHERPAGPDPGQRVDRPAAPAQRPRPAERPAFPRPLWASLEPCSNRG